MKEAVHAIQSVAPIAAVLELLVLLAPAGAACSTACTTAQGNIFIHIATCSQAAIMLKLQVLP